MATSNEARASTRRRSDIGRIANLKPVIAPICAECGADGRRVRVVRTKHHCLECGHEWPRE